jgi:hypothetical protein
MSKNKLLIAGGIILTLVLAFATGIYFFSRKSTSSPNSQPQPFAGLLNQDDKEEEINASETYIDSAGFSFKYPENIKISDDTPVDDSYYTLLTLNYQNKKLTISAMDSTDTKIVAPTGSDLIGASKLSTISANQYEDSSNLYTIALDKGVLYTIKSPKDSYWDSLHNTIVSSFVFEGQVANSGSGSAAASDTIYEAEEIVE